MDVPRFDFRFIVCTSLDIPSRHHSSIDYKYGPSNVELVVETRSSAGGGSSSSLSTSSLASAQRVFKHRSHRYRRGRRDGIEEH